MQSQIKLIVIATLLATSAPARAQIGPCGDTAALGVQHAGKAIINGVAMPVTAWISAETKDLMPNLIAACSGRATVAVNRWPSGDVALIAPLRSRQCPLCPLPAPTLAGFAAQVYAVTSTVLPDGAGQVLIGSPIGQLYGVKPAAAYHGEAWPHLGPTLSAVVQANYRFAQSDVGSLTATTHLTPAAALAAADADLIANGYALFGGVTEQPVGGSAERTYRRAQSVLHVRITTSSTTTINASTINASTTNITISASRAG